jgi:hypothetical protein
MVVCSELLVSWWSRERRRCCRCCGVNQPVFAGVGGRGAGITEHSESRRGSGAGDDGQWPRGRQRLAGGLPAGYGLRDAAAPGKCRAVLRRPCRGSDYRERARPGPKFRTDCDLPAILRSGPLNYVTEHAVNRCGCRGVHRLGAEQRRPSCRRGARPSLPSKPASSPRLAPRPVSWPVGRCSMGVGGDHGIEHSRRTD